MTFSKTTGSVLKKIKNRGLRPRARWEFLLRRAAIFVGALAFLGFGVLAAAGTIHSGRILDMPEMMHGPRPGAIFQLLALSLPIFWIGAFAALWWLTNFFVRRTGRAYKIPVWVWMCSLLFVQIAGGVLLHRHVMVEHMEKMAAENVPFYSGVERTRQRVWRNPEMGALAGEILKISDDTILILEDFSQKIWEVDFSKAKIRSGTEISSGEKIRMLGEPVSKTEFSATRIVPWNPDFQQNRPPRPESRAPKNFRPAPRD
ncbi:hypothetical protein HN954_00675 [bacterium]|nr:hypothetical protein [bacterium]MBT6832383.1 hypothetical protein [bacterium]MBT6995928.1 hypothetical protein [bacterium]MBT7772789.1 hypothetical protein [bacterium]